MAVLGFDLFMLGFVLLLVAILAWGRVRGDFDRRNAYVFAGMFLAFVPALGSNVASSAGLSGRSGWLVRGLLAVVGIGGLVLALFGLRLDEDEHTDGGGGNDGSAAVEARSDR